MSGRAAAEEVAAFIASTAAGTDQLASQPAARSQTPAAESQSVDLGVRLFDIGGQRRAAYVDRVRPNSLAEKAGIRKNDLIVSFNGRMLATAVEYYEAAKTVRSGERVSLVIKRKNELLTIDLAVPAGD